jgi:hypothetical protein
MKTNLIKLIFVLSLIFFLMQGCFSLASTTTKPPDPTPIQTLPPLPTATLTPQPTIDLLPGYTPKPTLSPEHEFQLVELLNDSDCTLPCYLGITPGKTSISEAVAILKSLGAYHDERHDNYVYRLDIGDPLISPMLPNRYALVWAHVDLTPINELVQVIDVGIGTEKTNESLKIFREYWTRYSASGIFSELGQPEEVYTGVGKKGTHNHSLLISYENKGVFIRIQGSWQENNLCSSGEDLEIYVHMILFDPASSLSILDFNPGIGDPSQWPPVNDTLGISVDEFFQQVIWDNTVCFGDQ